MGSALFEWDASEWSGCLKVASLAQIASQVISLRYMHLRTNARRASKNLTTIIWLGFHSSPFETSNYSPIAQLFFRKHNDISLFLSFHWKRQQVELQSQNSLLSTHIFTSVGASTMTGEGSCWLNFRPLPTFYSQPPFITKTSIWV